MACRPLSTYTREPVIPDASGEHRNAAVWPISIAVSGFSLRGALDME